MSGQDVLLVFVKAPRPGFVKTRLAAVLGSELAAAFYRAMAERVIVAVSPPAGTYDRAFVYAPADGFDELAPWIGGDAGVAQVEGDLGARMAGAFDWAFARGASRVVLVGTDTPEVSSADVTAAHEALRGNDLVLGPALDGGYYLIGLRAPAPVLIERMSWSTTTVLDETLARAEAADLRTTSLPLRGDIDTLDDLRRDWRRIKPWLPVDLAQRIEHAVER
jgi:rSAM/selenodomain-associated transferase 1